VANRDFIGRGWRFPFQFDERTGGVAKDEGDNTDRQLTRVSWSIQQIIGVRQGEMLLSRRFGSRFRDLVFQLTTANLAQRLEWAAIKALEDREYGEHRAFIDQVRVKLPGSDGKADIDVAFVMRASNVPGNTVFPFYLQGTARESAETGFGE